MRIILVVIAGVIIALTAAVSSAGVDEPTYVVDSPTGGLLAHGEYLLRGRIGPQSAILVGGELGLGNVFQIGVSFGMQGVLDRADITVNDHVGFHARLRLIEESNTPAFAVGFSSQGVGKYDETQNRYERKSKGFYAVVSKNWRFLLGEISGHGGANYSLERDDDDTPNAFVALDWLLFHGVSILGDLDAALNDGSDDTMYGRGGVYLDAALRVTYGENLSMMLIFRDLTGNYGPNRHVGRELEIAYMDTF